MTDGPIFICEACNEPIIYSGGTTGGTIVFSYQEWYDKRAATEAWDAAHGDEAHDMATLLNRPGYVLWHPRHYGKCMDGLRVGYGIEIDNIQSWRDVAEWSAHLHSKKWFRHTDWQKLLGSAGLYRTSTPR